ncbi:serine/threonine-protein kinase [Streptomyces sp. NPDC050617]|uniref:serine/threonine-protein kinase n=1 Tax=Streptomyces sp. NPDC050617 TaxID=3154628 RepID=UPI003432099B
MNPLGTGDPLRLGPYRMLGVLGEGGMGKVYAGQDSAGRVAAVKVLRPELAHDQNLAQRFVREARTAQSVTGKGVARVLGAQTEGGRPWIAAEFLTGPTLDEAVTARGPFDEPAVRALAASLARTLAGIHAAGLVHRDLKPANIVLTSDGPRVIDFGIARPEHGLTLTTTGQVPVTPGYGAPEQVLGQRVAPAADVFSLGAVLVYAASGHRAFDGPHAAAVQYEVVHGAPRLDRIPEPLRPFVAPCLAKDPALRPSPDEVAAASAPPRGAGRVWRRGWLAEDIEERERAVRQLIIPSPERPPAGRVSRRRVLTGLAAGGALAAAGGSAGWLLHRRDTSFDIPPAVALPEARPQRSISDADTKKGPTPLWGPLPMAATSSPAPLPVRDVVVFAAEGGGIAAHDVIDGRRRWTARGVRTAGGYVSLSDQLVAALDAKGTLVTFVASTGKPNWTADAHAAAILAADDDAVYVVTKDGRLRGISRSDAETRWTVRVSVNIRADDDSAPWAATGRGRLIVGSGDGHVVAVDTRDGREAWSLRNQGAELIRPAVSGTTVYLNGGSLAARRISDGEEEWTATSTGETGKNESWGPPTVTGDAVYAAHGDQMRRLSRKDGSRVWEGEMSGRADIPIVVQGAGVWWGNEPHGEVSALKKDSGALGWAYEMDAEDHCSIAADGNRVFVVNGPSLIALPVF